MGAFNPDNLLMGTGNIPVTNQIILPAGTYKRGTAIGKLDGAYKSIGNTGYTKDTIWCILAEDVTSESEIRTTGYFTGEFRASAVIIGKDTVVVTVNELVDPARKIGMFII